MVRGSKNSSSTPVLPRLSSKLSTGRQPSPSAEKSSAADDRYPAGLSSEGRIIFEMLSEKLDSIARELRVRDEKMEGLMRENEELKAKLLRIERQQDDQDAQYRRNNLILSGSALASVTADVPAQGVIELLRNKIQYDLPRDNIISAYSLGVRPPVQSEDNRMLMVKLREGQKDDIQAACRKVIPSGLYANDDLTPTRAKVLSLLRHAKRKSNGKIVSCGSIGGRVYAYVPPPNVSSKSQRIFLNDIGKLRSFCERELGISIEDISSGTAIP